MTRSALTHLGYVEAESIHIMCEAIAESANPVLLHLAMKAFHSPKPRPRLLHIDVTWKFREMYAFREPTVKQLGLDLKVSAG